MGKVIAFAAFLLVGACAAKPSVDVFCETHTVEDFRPSVKEFGVLTLDQKRRRLAILQEGEKRCGWRPTQ